MTCNCLLPRTRFALGVSVIDMLCIDTANVISSCEKLTMQQSIPYKHNVLNPIFLHIVSAIKRVDHASIEEQRQNDIMVDASHYSIQFDRMPHYHVSVVVFRPRSLS